MPLSGAIERHAATLPANPAFRLEDRVLSYGALAATARRLHAAFAALSPGCGSVIGPQGRLVALATGNHALFPAAFAAATAGGNCAALVDPHLPEAQRRRIEERLSPDLLVVASGPDLLLSTPRTGLSTRIAETALSEDPALPEGDDEAPFLVVFTSGTTAEPKAIIRDRRSWRISLATGAPFFGIEAGTATFSPGPLAHGLALYAMTETLIAGGTFHSARHFDAAAALAAIRTHAIRRLVLVPTMLRRLCDGPEAPVTGVEAVTVAGAKLTAGDRACAAARFPKARLREYYGASELGFVSVTDPGGGASPTAVGRAFPGVRLSVHDEAGRPLPPGERGTVFVESPLVATGYLGGSDGAGLRRLGERATVGDLGFIEADGTLHLLGRSGGMILSGGNNIYPSEVESALSELPFVHTAHVLGLDQPDLGTELVAVVEPAAPPPSRAALLAALDRVLPRYKQPRRLWLCRALPSTSSGKVAVKTLRRWVEEESDELERLL